MKIAIIHHQYAKKGGMESYLFDLISGFTNQGDNIDMFTYKIAKNTPVGLNCRIILDNKLAFFPKFMRKFLFIDKINKQFKRSEFDLSLNLTRTSSQDIVVCGGTHLSHLQHAQKTPGLKDRLEIYFEQKSFNKTPMIIAHSQMLKDEIINLYNIDAKKVHLIYPPINTARFNHALKAQQHDLAKKFNISPTKTTLLFPSTGHKRKGLVELLEAMKQFSQDQVELLIAGDPIGQNSLSNNVRCLGFVQNIEELYAAVDFTILPAHYEPFGLVAIESVQCGTPVIISKYVGAKDLLSDNESIIIEQINSESIVLAIQKAINHQFKILPNFAENKDLTVDAHINKIKNMHLSS